MLWQLSRILTSQWTNDIIIEMTKAKIIYQFTDATVIDMLNMRMLSTCLNVENDQFMLH